MRIFVCVAQCQGTTEQAKWLVSNQYQ